MNDTTWTRERIAERVTRERDAAVKEVEWIRGERDAMERRAQAAEGELEALDERMHYLERYIREPAFSVLCVYRDGPDSPCGGCEGCITAQVIYGVTGKVFS